MPFGVVGWMGSEMRQVVWFGDRSTGRRNVGGEYGALHCNQWSLRPATWPLPKLFWVLVNVYYGRYCLQNLLG